MVATVGAVVLLGATSGLAGGEETAGPDGAASADCPWLTDRMTDLAPTQERNAKIITVVAYARGLGETGAAIAIAAALAETTLYNLANDGTSTLIGSLEGRQLTDTERAVARRSLFYPHDEVGSNLDSVGLFQQRPMAGWGPPEVLIDPAKATGLFFDHLARLPNWRSDPPWESAQQVQGSPSSDGEIYRSAYQQAQRIVAEVTAALPEGSEQVPPDQATAIVAGLCRASALRGSAAAFSVPVIGSDRSTDSTG